MNIEIYRKVTGADVRPGDVVIEGHHRHVRIEEVRVKVAEIDLVGRPIRDDSVVLADGPRPRKRTITVKPAEVVALDVDAEDALMVLDRACREFGGKPYSARPGSGWSAEQLDAASTDLRPDDGSSK